MKLRRAIALLGTAFALSFVFVHTLANAQTTAPSPGVNKAVASKAIEPKKDEVRALTVAGSRIYYNTGGDVVLMQDEDITGDLVIIASGNVTTKNLKAGGNLLVVAGATSFHFQELDKPADTSPGQKTVGVNDLIEPFDSFCNADCSNSVVIDSQTSAGTVTINGDIESTNQYVTVKTATNSDGNTIKITGNATAKNSSQQFIFLEAGGNIGVNVVNVDAAPGQNAGGINIRANTAKGGGQNSPTFMVGSAGQANGVQSLSAVNAVTQFGGGFVYVRNGGKGGIQLLSPSAISISVAQGRNGALYLDSRHGNITLPAGKLSLDGQNGNGAGSIIINANKIITNNSEISVDDVGTGVDHYIALIAETLDQSGNTSIHANGLGDTSNPHFGNVQFFPAGAIIGGSDGSCGTQFTQFPGLIVLDCTYDGSKVGPVTVTGGGTLNVGSDAGSMNSRAGVISMTAFNARFFFTGGSTVNVHANGSSGAPEGGLVHFRSAKVDVSNNSSVLVESSGNTTAGTGGTVKALLAGNSQENIKFSNGKGGIHALAKGLKGGTIHVDASGQVTFDDLDPALAPSVDVSASGSSGDAGTIIVSALEKISFPRNAELHADGKDTGNGGTIHLKDRNGGINATSSGQNRIKVSAIAGSNGGDGGRIELISDFNQVKVEPANALVTAGTNGDGGNIYVFGLGLNLGGTTNTFRADGNGTGNGGTLWFEDFGTQTALVIGGTGSGSGPKLSAVGGQSGGNGGSATVISNQGDITVTGADITVDAGTSGNGRGGDITVSQFGQAGANTSARTITITGALKANGKASGDGGNVIVKGLGLSIAQGQFEANGGMTGNGGLVRLEEVKLFGGSNPGITITSPTLVSATGGSTSGDGGTAEIISENGNITIDSAFLTPSLNVSAGQSSDGNGGTLTISGMQVTATGELDANGVGSGNGGSISITVTGPTPMTLSNLVNSNEQQVIISAHAGVAGSNPNGEGGTVTINKAAGTIDPAHLEPGINVPMIIRVDGGPTRVPGQSYGSISLNGVTCKQWKTAALVYPQVAWDCITPDTGENIGTLVSAGSSLLPPTLKQRLANLVSPPPADQMVGVYAMNELQDFLKFFGRPSEVYSEEYGRSSVSWLRVSGTFAYSQGVSNATLSGSPTIMVGALVHELGHHLDYIFGPGLMLLSSQTAWNSLIAPDFATMDNMPCNAVFFQATCDVYSATKTNSEIFKIQFPGMYDHVTDTPDPGELFAAMFEHVESFLTGNPPSYQVEPELEKALDTMVQLKAYMSNLIANPPLPVK